MARTKAELESENEALRSELERWKKNMIMLDTWGLDLIEKLGQLVRQTACDGPLTTCIECQVGNEGETVPVVWLWATADEKQPIVRIQELAAENERLKERQRVLLGAASQQDNVTK